MRWRAAGGRDRSTTDEFLDRVFQELLGRPPDPEARAHYRDRLARGTTRTEVVLTVATSDERAQRVIDTHPELVPARHYPVHVAEQTYGGVPLSLCIGDQIGHEWYGGGWPETPEVAFLQQHGLGPGSIVFDLGAHQGVYALIFSRVVGPEGRVVAVEANRFNAGIAEVNRRINGADNVQVLHAAAADRPGEIGFGRGGNGRVDRTGTCYTDTATVRAVTVDELAESHGPPDVVFVDVEGYECHVLRGAAASLERRPSVHVEVHAGQGLELFGGSVESLLEFFPRTDYQLHVSDETIRQPLPLTPESMARTNGRCYLTAIGRR